MWGLGAALLRIPQQMVGPRGPISGLVTSDLGKPPLAEVRARTNKVSEIKGLKVVCFLNLTASQYKSLVSFQSDGCAVVFLRLYLCTFTLAVSGGAVFLLPFSIISNEILLSFPKNYYIQWLNGSLIHGQYIPHMTWLMTHIRPHSPPNTHVVHMYWIGLSVGFSTLISK